MDETSLKIVCTYCNTEQVENYKFCSNCGKKNESLLKKEKKRSKEFDNNLKFLSGYALFTILLILFASLADDTFQIIVVLTVIFALADISFAIAQPSVWKLFKINHLKIGPALSIFAICIASGILVSYSMDNLNSILFEETYSEMPLFYHLDYPLFWAILVIGVFPAIFEELAFRGFVYKQYKSIIR
jgi:membrane protease YdiL (CAAX protease family)